jgi:hypothetical protein
MGMFDYVHFQGLEYQSRNTPNQTMDKYKIESDQESGQEYLWVEEYDCEYVKDEESLLGGYIKQFNQHWVFLEDFDGVITIYRQNDDKTKWITYKFLFMNGRMIKKQYFEEDYER